MPTIPVSRPKRASGASAAPQPPSDTPEDSFAPSGGFQPPPPAGFDPFSDDDSPGQDAPLNVGAAMAEAQKKKIAARKLPPLPPRLKWEEMIDYWRQLNPDQKSHLVIYWYRLRPIIDRKQTNPDNPNYIDVASSDDQFTMEYMINTHGGGKYHGRVNDTDIRKNGQIADIHFEINTAQHDPIINLEELDILNRENQAYVNKLKAAGRLSSDGRIIKNPTAEARRDENMNTSVTNRLLDAVLNKPVQPSTDPMQLAVLNNYMEILKGQIQADSPKSQLDMLLALVDRFKPNQPATPPTDPMQTFMQMQSMLDAQRAVFESKISALQDKLLTIAAEKPPAPSLTEEIEKIKTVAEAIGLGASGGKTSWIDRLIDVAAPAIPAIANIIQSRMAPSPQQMANPGIPRMPNDLDTSLAIVPVPGHPQPTAEESMNILDTVIAQAGGDLITSIANGTPGDQAAEAVYTLKGAAVYNMIIKDGKEGILAAMQRNAQFWQAVNKITTLERLEKFVNDFIAYGAEDDDEVATPPAVPAKVKAN